MVCEQITYIDMSEDAINIDTSEIRRSKGKFVIVLFGLLLGIFFSLLIISYGVTIRDWGYSVLPTQTQSIKPNPKGASQFKSALQNAERKVKQLQYRFKKYTPNEPHLIIDTSENLIFLKSGKKILLQGICSTGSYTLLKTANETENWIFKTPRGMFRIQNKIVDPVWRMPDWAFVEEGLPIPPPYSKERYEPGVLGDYALDLGRGYLIHGTLYQRFLGLPVTHGCVRLGDKELRIVYRSLHIGSKVYIY